jgi:hypothetical protein
MASYSRCSEFEINCVLIATPGEFGSNGFPQAVIWLGSVPLQKNVATASCTGQAVCLVPSREGLPLNPVPKTCVKSKAMGETVLIKENMGAMLNE